MLGFPARSNFFNPNVLLDYFLSYLSLVSVKFLCNLLLLLLIFPSCLQLFIFFQNLSGSTLFKTKYITIFAPTMRGEAGSSSSFPLFLRNRWLDNSRLPALYYCCILLRLRRHGETLPHGQLLSSILRGFFDAPMLRLG